MKHRFFRILSACLASAAVMCCCTAPTTAAESITSENFNNDGTYLSDVYAGCTPAHINAGVDQNGYIEVWRDGTQLDDSEKLSTGDTVKLVRNSSVLQTLDLVVTGDVNGDGKLNAVDLLTAQMTVLGVYGLGGSSLEAAKMNDDNILDASDLVILQQYALGIGTPTIIDGFYNSDGYINAVPVKVGNPGLSRYAASGENNNFARSVWDMQTYGGKVYFGSGDYDKNMNPSYIGCYDPETDEAYIFQDRIDDEQVDRFRIIDGKLVVPGTDPANNSVMHYLYLNEAENSFVNYYMNTDGRLHNFDMIEFDGKIFMGGGTTSGRYASGATVSTDGGLSFSNVEMVYSSTVVNGYNVGGYSRVYDFFEVGGELYALFTHYGNSDGKSYSGIYKYDADANQFVYHASSNTISNGRSYAYYGNNEGWLSYSYCQGTAAIGSKLAICNGYLLTTENMSSYKTVTLVSGGICTDIIKVGDTAYTLTMTENDDGTFTNYVHKSTDLVNFTKVMQFDSSTYMRSMEYVDGMFVFGAGTRLCSSASADSGTIYRVKVDF